MVAALTLLRVGLRMPRCASTTAPMALSCGVTTACMCARRPSLDQSRNVCRAAAYSGGCRAVVARPRDNLALSLAARQPCPLGEVVARYRATTSPLRRGGPHPLFFDRATTSPLRRGCRAVPRDNLALFLTARQPRPLGEVVARPRDNPSLTPLRGEVVARRLSRVARHCRQLIFSRETTVTVAPSDALLGLDGTFGVGWDLSPQDGTLGAQRPLASRLTFFTLTSS